MTLREVIDNVGATVSCPRELEDMDCNTCELSTENLLNYFNSSNFQNDIPKVMEKIHIAKEKGYDKFSLFFSTDPEIKLSIFSLNF